MDSVEGRIGAQIYHEHKAKVSVDLYTMMEICVTGYIASVCYRYSYYFVQFSAEEITIRRSSLSLPLPFSILSQC